MDEAVAAAARVWNASSGFLRRQRDAWSGYWASRISGTVGEKGEDSPREGASEKEAR
jgi:hypothetical protein